MNGSSGSSPRDVWSGLACAALGSLGVTLGLLAIFGEPLHLEASRVLPFMVVRLGLDPLGGLFMAITGGVAVVVGIYSIGYSRREHLTRFPLAVLPIFVAALLLVPAAESVTTFLLAWELMALASLALVLAEHRREAVRSAGVYYAVLTQLGFVTILIALVILTSAAGADDFATLGAATLPGWIRSAVFLLTVLGFGSKAGLLPLHAWLPRAHPEAPSPVSALMSAAMVNMGIYGIVRFDLEILGPGPRWWGLTLMGLGALSAVYGVLQASVATDLKRLLAYSTTENMGLIALALGAAALLQASGVPSVAVIAATAALVHLVAHAAFKTLGFLAAGSVLAGTGLRDLDRLGGLARRMPHTTVLFGIAALGAAGLPLGAGFISEWLLIQSLIHTPQGDNTLLSLAMPLAVGAVALTTGLGILTMVKAFGVGFLARPRSEGAEGAREGSPTMIWGMYLAAIACMAIAIAPMILGPILTRVLPTVPTIGSGEAPDFGVILRLPGGVGSMSPTIIAGALVLAGALALLLSRWGASHRPAPVAVPLWSCGGGDLSPKMQYTATSFAEPLQRVFDDVLRPDTDVAVTHVAESRYLIERVTYKSHQADSIERRLYTPVIGVVTALAKGVRRVHTGSIHLYLLFGALGLLVAIVVAR